MRCHSDWACECWTSAVVPGHSRARSRRATGMGWCTASRSAVAIRQARATCAGEIAAGRVALRQVAIERFELDGEEPFDIAVAIRVGALDGRHPELEPGAHRQILRELRPHGRFFTVMVNAITPPVRVA